MLLKDKFKEILKIFAVLSLCALFFMVYKVSAQSNSPSSSSESYFFNYDLKLGDTGDGVRELQKVLNSNSATVVANDGPGSPGNETEYFGTLTKWAVISFQEQYRSEILTPNGLSSGTGFVGSATRAKLNAVSVGSGVGSGGGSSASSGNQNSSQNPVSTLVIPVPSTVVAPPVIPTLSAAGQSSFMQSLFPQKISLLNVSKYQVSPGDTVLIGGAGFASGENFLHIGDNRTTPLLVSTTPSSVPGTTLMQATIPTDLALGKYEVWITKGQNGTAINSSRNSSVPFFILVTDNPKSAPTVSNVSPFPVDSSGQIVITGSGFTSGGNNIYSTLGNILNVPVSSDGSITVKVSDFPGAAQVRKTPGSQSFVADGWLYVQNENGVNNTPAAFKVKF